MRVVTAAHLRDPAASPHGKPVAIAGLVLVRQRPGTAAGIVFMTLEDETGASNLILFPNIYERFRKAARHSAAVVAWGAVERAGMVVHVMVRRIVNLRDAVEFQTITEPVSRDFR
jgi:error-prone DNA polymerase